MSPFNACYYALRGERVAVVAPICSTDPLWTALFSWLIVGAAFGGATLVDMAVAHARRAAARHLALPNNLRRTAAILSHWMPSVGLSSLGQASMQLAMVWQR